MKSIDMTGQKVGMLTCLEKVGIDKLHSTIWKCRCDCGKECELSRPVILRLRSPSCGCQKWAGNRKANKRDRNATYKTWTGLSERCYNPNGTGYACYGGRGITVCDEWRADYNNFLKDMGDKPVGMTLDRIDNNGPYSKANCRWATRKEQAQNKRTTVRVTIDGVTKCATEWAAEKGVPPDRVLDRVRRGWAVEDLFIPPLCNSTKKA